MIGSEQSHFDKWLLVGRGSEDSLSVPEQIWRRFPTGVVGLNIGQTEKDIFYFLQMAF